MSGKLWACSMSVRLDVELSLRNNGVKAVAYKCYASTEACWSGRSGDLESYRETQLQGNNDTFPSRFIQELAFGTQQLAAIYGGSSFFSRCKENRQLEGSILALWVA